MTDAPNPTAPPSATRAPLPAKWAVAIGGLSAIAGVVINLVALALGRSLGADMSVRPSGSSDVMTVGVGLVVAMTVGPIFLGTVLLLVLRGRGVAAWWAAAWAGLAVGVVTVLLPLTATAATATKSTLAPMHVIAGVAWFGAIAIELRHADRKTRAVQGSAAARRP